MAKPKAEDRTIDIFSGKTAMEEKSAACEVIEEAPKGSETIEQAAERWRATAFWGSEHFSKSWPDRPREKGVYRLTEKDGNLFLEQFVNGTSGNAYKWAGVMFSTSDLYEITSVFVKASKDKQLKESKGG